MSDEVVLSRIAADTHSFEAHDLGGKGAELSGGRWNRSGTPMVYASASRALAYLETVVYLAKVPLPLNRYLVEVRVPRDLGEAAAAFDAPRFIGWDAEPAGKASFDWGTAWARGTSTLLALVPSVIVVEESNVLINPAHPDAKRLRAAKLRRWLYDGRLVT